MSRLSRAEAIAAVKEEAKRLEALKLPLGPYQAIFSWAVLVDDAVMELQRRLADTDARQLEFSL